ncbi:MAG: hypothetical protein ACRYF5_05940 [Janthinobacterium lividum]
MARNAPPALPQECWLRIAAELDIAPKPVASIPGLLARFERVVNMPDQGLPCLAALACVSRAHSAIAKTALQRSSVGGERSNHEFVMLFAQIASKIIPLKDVHQRVVEICGRWHHLTVTFRDKVFVGGSQFTVPAKMYSDVVLPAIFSSLNWDTLTLGVNFHLSSLQDNGKISSTHISARTDFLTTLGAAMAARPVMGKVSLNLSPDFASHACHVDLFAGTTPSDKTYFSAIDCHLPFDGAARYDFGLAHALTHRGSAGQGLQALSLDGSKGTVTVDAILDAVRSNPNLLALDLKRVSLRKKSVLFIHKLMEENQTLEQLAFSCRGAPAEPWLAGLAHNRTLRSLSFEWDAEDPQGDKFRREIDCIIRNRTLSSVTLLIPYLRKPIGEAVAFLIEHNQTLRELAIDLSNCRAWGMYAIFKALQKNQGLERFAMVGLNMTKAGARHLYKSLNRRETPLHLILNIPWDSRDQPVGDVTDPLRDLLAENPLIRCSINFKDLEPAR